jgi:hypothetical protein
VLNKWAECPSVLARTNIFDYFRPNFVVFPSYKVFYSAMSYLLPISSVRLSFHTNLESLTDPM